MNKSVQLSLTQIPEEQATEDTFSRWLERIEVAERQRILRYRQWEDRYRALGAALLARFALSCMTACRMEDIRLKRTPLGRPYREASTGYKGDFNVSHHGRWVGCSVVTEGRVGMDIVLPTEFDLSLHSGMLDKGESTFVDSLPDALETKRVLAELWALKEAYAKMTGMGLTTEPSSIGFDMVAWQRGDFRLSGDGERLQRQGIFHLRQPSPEVLVAICSDQTWESVSMHRVGWESLCE